MKYLLTGAALLAAGVEADVYMHNPRGSNDRNCERNANRNNGNRLFDSQNNAAGGYACPRAVGDETIQDEDGLASLGYKITQDMKIYYYEDSVLPIEWTNQHGCGPNSKVNCEIIVQYMCEDTADPQVDNVWPWSTTKWGPNTANAGEKVGKQGFRSNSYIAAPRDGIPRDANDAATDTIPNNLESAVPNTKETRRFGMHESYDHYDRCSHTERNNNLYTADQNMRRRDQRATRQNPNGNRNGFECPEERDYYPWWQPSPWIDIAILTNEGPTTKPCVRVTACGTDPSTGETGYCCVGSDNVIHPNEDQSARCVWYLQNSQNKNKKGFCDSTEDGTITDKTESTAWKQNKWYNNKEDCEENKFQWKGMSFDDIYEDMSYPTCGMTSFSRVNHLGNSMDDEDINSNNFFEEGSKTYLPNTNNANRFVWTVPKIPEPKSATYFTAGMEESYKSCTLRLRYNISTSDFQQWPDEAIVAGDHQDMVDSGNNTKKGKTDALTPVVQDPYIYIGPGDSAGAGSQFVSLAVNTNQYGRTFQDRSYKFAIKRRPTNEVAEDNSKDSPKILKPGASRIFNVNVRGKRGNIVQTYPSVEYDFVPNRLALDANDYVHFQWTGSDYNPRRGCNNGEGGPPDPNLFHETGNAKQNSRADRSNLIFMNTMAENLPMDMLGVDSPDAISDNFDTAKALAMATASQNLPCTGGDANADEACYKQAMRLAYLNQQSDGGSLSLRRDKSCLSETELDAIKNKNERENHPLNCAKLNAKPYPYFDGGMMKLNQAGKYAYFSSRNNNFSNRDQTGVVCVRNGDGTGCDEVNGVLQDDNKMVSTAQVRSKAFCNDEASDYSVGNNFGAASCISLDLGLLDAETRASTQADNDKMGDGNAEPCDTIIFFFKQASLQQKVGLAIALLFVGMGSAWGGYYAYNRYDAISNAGKKFAGNTKWKGAKNTEMI